MTTGFSFAKNCTHRPLRDPSSRLDPTRPPPPGAPYTSAAAALLAQVVLCTEGRQAAEKTTGALRPRSFNPFSLKCSSGLFAACCRTSLQHAAVYPRVFLCSAPARGTARAAHTRTAATKLASAAAVTYSSEGSIPNPEFCLVGPAVRPNPKRSKLFVAARDCMFPLLVVSQTKINHPLGSYSSPGPTHERSPRSSCPIAPLAVPEQDLGVGRQACPYLIRWGCRMPAVTSIVFSKIIACSVAKKHVFFRLRVGYKTR